MLRAITILLYISKGETRRVSGTDFPSRCCNKLIIKSVKMSWMHTSGFVFLPAGSSFLAHKLSLYFWLQEERSFTLEEGFYPKSKLTQSCARERAIFVVLTYR